MSSMKDYFSLNVSESNTKLTYLHAKRLGNYIEKFVVQTKTFNSHKTITCLKT